MNSLSEQYAQALHELVTASPKEGQKYLHNLRTVLKRHGHEKLLPQIFSAYQRLDLQAKRQKQYQTITPEAHQTRTLLELYRTLITTA